MGTCTFKNMQNMKKQQSKRPTRNKHWLQDYNQIQPNILHDISHLCLVVSLSTPDYLQCVSCPRQTIWAGCTFFSCVHLIYPTVIYFFFCNLLKCMNQKTNWLIFLTQLFWVWLKKVLPNGRHFSNSCGGLQPWAVTVRPFGPSQKCFRIIFFSN